jgi:pyrroline-5-carboxylate reductase
MSFKTIAILGAGNMGSSLIGGLIRDGHPAEKIWASDVSEEKLLSLQQVPSIHTTLSNIQAAQSADVVIFAVKPQYIAPIATEIAAAIQTHQPLIISIAAGIRLAHLQQYLGPKTAIVRAMPNTPALIGCGATALYANAHVTSAQHDLAESILRAVGTTLWLPQEELMDCVTALSGSGPAYFFLIMEALEQAAAQLGLDSETAHLLTLQTALGAVRMAIESGDSLVTLRHRVTSPQGTTEKAISVLESNNIRSIFLEALRAAKLRSEELGK